MIHDPIDSAGNILLGLVRVFIFGLLIIPIFFLPRLIGGAGLNLFFWSVIGTYFWFKAQAWSPRARMGFRILIVVFVLSPTIFSLKTLAGVALGVLAGWAFFQWRAKKKAKKMGGRQVRGAAIEDAQPSPGRGSRLDDLGEQK